MTRQPPPSSSSLDEGAAAHNDRPSSVSASGSWGRYAGVMLAFYVVALAAFRWAGALGTPGSSSAWPVVVVGLVVVVADVALRRLVRPPRVDGPADLARRLGWPALGGLLGVGLVMAWWVDLGGWGWDESWAALGGVLVYFAAGQGVTELRTSQVGAPWRGPGVLGVCGLAVAAGLATASSPGLTVPVVAVAGGLLLSPVGISLLTEDLLARGVSNRWVVASVGGVVLAAGVVLLAVQNVHPVLLVWLTVGVLVLVAAIASNTEADVIIVAAVVVLVWALAPRDAAMAPPVVTEVGQTVLVAMGDSFISGEGAPRFYKGTNVRGENECRRAPTAYPVLLAERGVEGAQGLVFVACSGARADPATGQLADQISQARAQLEAGRLTPSMVLVSIGGNDAWFGHIATTCVLPGDCSKIGQRWLDHLGTLGPTLDAAYTLLRTELGDLGAPIVVVPYANPIAGVGCEASTFTMAEHRFLHAYTEELNVQIMDAAKRNGLNVATTMRAALRKTSLRLCDAPADQVGVNFLAANPVAGVLRDRVNPRHWFHNSLHPNPRGHQALADVFEQWRARFDELPAPGPEPQPNAGRPVVPRLEILIGDPRFDHCGRADTKLTFCEKTTAQWRFDETLRTVRLAAVPLLALAVGAWLLSLAALARLRDRDRQRTSQELMA